MKATSIELFIVKNFLHTSVVEILDNDKDMEDLMPSTTELVAYDAMPIPILSLVWNYTLEYTYQRIIAPFISANADSRMSVTVHHIKPSPKQQDWLDEY